MFSTPAAVNLMPKADTQFTKDNLPNRPGLGSPRLPVASAKAFNPIGVRFYDGDHQRLMAMGRERADFIRDTIHEALKNLPS